MFSFSEPGKFLTIALAPLMMSFQHDSTHFAPNEVRISSRPYQQRISFHSEIKLVQLEVVVRDRKGDPVSGLTKEDFALTDSGRVREIAAFSIERTASSVPLISNAPAVGAGSATKTQDSPTSNQTQTLREKAVTEPSAGQRRYIALLFDDINTSNGDLAHAKKASVRFIREALKSDDRIAVFTTSSGRMLDFTSDTTAVVKSLDVVQAHQRISPGGLAACPRITCYDAYRIVNNDPSAMKAAMSRACNCAGDSSCDIDAIPDDMLLNPASRVATSMYGGGGTLSSLISSVKAQAQQTWDMTRQASQATLDGVTSTLDLLTTQPGKRMLLLTSSGFLSGSLEVEIDQIINDAVRQGVVINSLDAKGLYAESPGGSFTEIDSMTRVTALSIAEDARSLGDRLDSVDSAPAKFAESTGGLMFKNNNDLSLGFYRLGMVPSITYLLAFPPAEDGKYHKITVKLANKSSGEFVQVRPGYQAPPSVNAKQASPVDSLDREVAAKDTPQDFPATVSVQPGAEGQHKLTLQNHVELQKLPFQHQKGRQVEELIFVAALFDDQGKFVTGKEAEMNLALKPESFARLSASGIKAAMSLEAPAGSYRLRTVIEEGVQHKMSASNQEVHIP